MHNNFYNQNDLKILDLDFSDLYQYSHIQLSLADLISKNEEDKPIIAAHPYDCNNISILSSKLLSEEEKREINKKLKNDEKEVKERCKVLSKIATEKEFNAIFALVEARKRPLLYIRWMPKSDELFMASRNNHKGHFVCLYFFQDSNSNKSILIANPNGKAIVDEYEAEVINSYLDKNKEVKIYQSRDNFQFGDTDCGPGALVFLRMLYNMSEEDFFNVLKKGQHNEKNRENLFDYSSVEFGNFLQKEIGKISKNKEEEKDIGQKLRQADYATAMICKENNNAIKNSDYAALALSDIPFDQKLVDDDLTEDQIQILNKILLSGKKLLTPEKVLQVEQSRQKLLKGTKDKKVKIKLEDGRVKYPNVMLSNERRREHQHTRENVKRVSEREKLSYYIVSNYCISPSDKSIKTLSTEISDKKKNSSLKSKIALAATCTFSILGIILFASFLSTNYIKKEVSILGLVLSYAMLIVSIASIFLIANNVKSKMDNPNMQQPIRSYDLSN